MRLPSDRGWTGGGSLYVRVIAVALLLGMPVLAQGARPTLVPCPLDLDPDPALKRFREELHEVYQDVLRTRGGVLLPSKPETRQALKDTRREDFRESNESMGLLARNAHTMYALNVWVQYAPSGKLVLVAKVVRDGGRLVKTETVQRDKKDDKLVDVFRFLMSGLLVILKLEELPLGDEVPVEPAKADAGVASAPDAGVAEPVDAGVPFIPPPPPPLVDEGEGQRTAGKVLVGTGIAAGVAGATLGIIGLVQAGGLTPVDGNLPASQASAYRSALALRPAGLVVGCVGAALTVVGAIVWGTAPKPPVQLVIAPQSDGAMIGVRGDLP